MIVVGVMDGTGFPLEWTLRVELSPHHLNLGGQLQGRRMAAQHSGAQCWRCPLPAHQPGRSVPRVATGALLGERRWILLQLCSSEWILGLTEAHFSEHKPAG